VLVPIVNILISDFNNSVFFQVFHHNQSIIMLYFWLTSAVHIANRASMAESADQSRKKDKKKKKDRKKKRKCHSTSSEPDLTASTADKPPMTNRPRTDSQPCISYASSSSLSE